MKGRYGMYHWLVVKAYSLGWGLLGLIAASIPGAMAMMLVYSVLHTFAYADGLKTGTFVDPETVPEYRAITFLVWLVVTAVAFVLLVRWNRRENEEDRVANDFPLT